MNPVFIWAGCDVPPS